MKEALLIIDVQKGILEYPYFHNPSDLLKNISLVQNRARQAGVPVIFVQHRGTDKEEPLHPETSGFAICEEIAPLPGEPVVLKETPDSFHRTELKNLLTSLGIEKLIMMGAQTEYCVDTTCRSAFSHGMKVRLVTDAHGTMNIPGGLSADEIIRHHNGVLCACFAEGVKAADVVFAEQSIPCRADA